MDVLDAAAASGRIAQVAHVKFPDERRLLLGLGVFDLPVYGGEDVGDGVLAKGFFTEHVFLARLSHDLDAGDAGAFLPTVVLLLHHEIELVQRIEFRTVFFLVILKRLEQPDHGDATFVLDLFHRMRLQGAKIIKKWLCVNVISEIRRTLPAPGRQRLPDGSIGAAVP